MVRLQPADRGCATIAPVVLPIDPGDHETPVAHQPLALSLLERHLARRPEGDSALPRGEVLDETVDFDDLVADADVAPLHAGIGRDRELGLRFADARLEHELATERPVGVP